MHATRMLLAMHLEESGLAKSMAMFVEEFNVPNVSAPFPQAREPCSLVRLVPPDNLGGKRADGQAAKGAH